MKPRTSSKVLFPELSFAVTGVLFEIHNTLGRFAREIQYAELMATALTERGITYERERVVPLIGGRLTAGSNRVDFVVDGVIVIELKAKPVLERIDYIQLQRYLQALDASLGVLVNFRERLLRPRRVLKVPSARIPSPHS